MEEASVALTGNREPQGPPRFLLARLLSCKEKPPRLALLALLFASYFGSLWLAALHFPRPYDWRINVISSLLSPRDNPQWHWLPCAGVALAALSMIPLAAWIERQLGDGHGKLARRLRRPAFLVGIGCLILAAIVAPRHAYTLLGMRRPHEALARASAAGLGLAMLCACFSPALQKTRTNPLRPVRILWRVITLPPILGAAGSGLIAALGQWHRLPAAPAAYIRGTLFWHLAFWEWIGSAAVFLFFAIPVAMLSGKRQERP